MHGERWAILSPLLDELLELTDGSRRRRLGELGSEDPTLADELARLMALEAESPDFMAQPVRDPDFFEMQADQEVGPYRLVSRLGEGGMGQVWLAVRADGLYERRVALKLLRPGLGDAGLLARFTRERQILARLGHAHIARLLDAGLSKDGRPYLALDYVRGEPITDYVQKRSSDLNERLRLFAQVCAAVSHAHANLVVHRDLKPSNILVSSSGDVCLLDFGIAKLLDQGQLQAADITRTGSRTFTLHYAAPEQLRGEIITTMADVYALGMVLYELLTDCKPYELARASDAAWEEAILGSEPVRPSQAAARKARETGSTSDLRRARLLSGDLDNIVLKALSKRPEDRYASAEALAQDLRRYLDGEPVKARAQSIGYRTRKYMHRHAVGLAVGLGATSVLAVALMFLSWQASKALKEAARAQAMQNFVIALFENSGDTSSTQGLDVRDLLDAGVSRADTELAAQPQARAELIGLIARLRSGLGDDVEALRLLDRQQEILLAIASPVPANLVLESAALRGHALLELSRDQQCLDGLGPVLPQANAAAQSFPLQASNFFSQLGRCHAAVKGNDAARALFERALKLRRDMGSAGQLIAESENDLAQLLLAAGQADAALQALRTALGHLRSGGGEQNRVGVDVWRNLGRAYSEQGNALEAEAAYRQSMTIALSRFGANHPATSAVQQDLAEVLVGNGKLAEAQRLLALSQNGLTARWGPDSKQLADQESLHAMLALERDEAIKAEALLADAVRIRRVLGDLDNNPWELCHLAQAQSELRQIAQADSNRHACLALLQGRSVDEQVRAIAGMMQSEMDNLDLGRARAWQALLPLGNKVAGPELPLANARLAQLSGQADAGRQIDDALARLSQDESSRRLRWQAQSLQAAQACLKGNPRAGAAMRAQTLAEASQLDPEHIRVQRRLTLLSAPCVRKS